MAGTAKKPDWYGVDDDIFGPSEPTRADVFTRFQPGKSGNPAGRPPEPAELKAVRALTKSQLAEIGIMVATGDHDALRAIMEDDGETVLKKMIASVCLKVIHKGDMNALDVLLNRLIGKVKDEIEHSGNGGAARVIVSLPSNGREAKTA